MRVFIERLSSPRDEERSAVERQAVNRAVAATLAASDCSAANSRNARRVRRFMTGPSQSQLSYGMEVKLSLDEGAV